MHGLIRDRLEEVLNGAPGGKLPREVEAHLAACEECRMEVGLMQEQSDMLQNLRPPREFELPAGFYARVMERIEARQSSSVWGAFLEPVFARRLAMACLTMVLLLGSFLALTETQTAYAPAGQQPEAAMAVEEHPPNLGSDPKQDRETILVDLATYRE